MTTVVGRLPRAELGVFPTPLESLPNLSHELGVEVLIKRDDLTGLALGGNKVRKLELLLGDARERGASWVVTTGAIQSNHCRCTAAAARRLGLGCHLVLFEGRHNEVQGNLLLDHLFGAQVEVHPASEQGRREDLLRAAAARHPHSYVIPFGGSNALGTAAYIWAYEELLEQLRGRAGTLFCVTSSGATHAGLALGAALHAGGPRVVGVTVSDPAPVCAPRVAELTGDAAELLGVSARPDVKVLEGYIGDGYAIPTPGGVTAIRRLARSDAILLDPVYTAKAMAALLEHARDFEAPLIFLHSGGLPALFAYADDLLPQR